MYCMSMAQIQSVSKYWAELLSGKLIINFYIRVYIVKQAYKRTPGAGCSKLTTLLVNVSLKFKS